MNIFFCFSTDFKSGYANTRRFCVFFKEKGLANMLQDTVLMGGAVFLISGAVIWFLLNKVNASQVSAQKKRLANYALLACLIAVAIFVIDWHSSNYKANYGDKNASAAAYVYFG